MYTREDKERMIKQVNDDLNDVHDSLEDLQKRMTEIEDLPVYEDTMQGQLDETVKTANQKIAKIVDDLNKKTGLNFALVFSDTRDVNIKDTNSGRKIPQGKVIENAIQYCVQNGSWESKKGTKNWILNKIHLYFDRVYGV